jgi:hypothetical protein
MMMRAAKEGFGFVQLLVRQLVMMLLGAKGSGFVQLLV